MFTSIFTPIRTLLLAVALAFAAQAVAAPSLTLATTTTTTHTKNEAAGQSDGTPIGGILIVAGIVAGVIVLAWICSRVSDNRRGNLMS